MGYGIGRDVAAGEPIDLVHHQDLRDLRGPDFRQHRGHVRYIIGRRGRGDIHHVQRQRGFGHLFERRAESLYEGGGLQVSSGRLPPGPGQADGRAHP